ncbi:MAG: hypothetical protein EBX59_06850 [Betaproteobacteria bacterium]|nr:hypothetical protein [Betaproteobacteria bacterium]
MKHFLVALTIGCLAGCSMFQRASNSSKPAETAQKAATLVTGMMALDVERLLGSPDSRSDEACRIAGRSVQCQVWRYSTKRKSTIWLHGEKDNLSVVMFDLEFVR